MAAEKNTARRFSEIEIETNGDLMLSDADRVRKKWAAWKKRADARKWLSSSSYALAQCLYPSIDTDLLRQRHLETQ
jgi:hypothetical protein